MTRPARIILLAVVGGFTALAVVLARHQPPLREPVAAPAALQYLPLPDGSAASESAGRILARTPFSPERGPFMRPSAQTGADALPLTGQVVLVSIRSDGLLWRATLLIDGAPHIVEVGDTTPLGPVAAIDTNAVSFNDPMRTRLELFGRVSGGAVRTPVLPVPSPAQMLTPAPPTPGQIVGPPAPVR